MTQEAVIGPEGAQLLRTCGFCLGWNEEDEEQVIVRFRDADLINPTRKDWFVNTEPPKE